MNQREYFDKMAGRWDEIHGNGHDAKKVLPLLKEGLHRFEIGLAERVVDLGCGTGVLLGCLLEHLGPAGRVYAVDFAPKMIARAREKHPDDRVRFLVADAGAIPVPDASVDRVVCFSAWPHFSDPDAVVRELKRILRPGGRLHVWHASSREKINDIHRRAHECVRTDLLETAGRLGERLRRVGLDVLEQRDDQNTYLVTGRKDGPR